MKNFVPPNFINSSIDPTSIRTRTRENSFSKLLQTFSGFMQPIFSTLTKSSLAISLFNDIKITRYLKKKSRNLQFSSFSWIQSLKSNLFLLLYFFYTINFYLKHHYTQSSSKATHLPFAQRSQLQFTCNLLLTQLQTFRKQHRVPNCSSSFR